METELYSIRFREKPVHFTLIKKRWFIHWCAKERNDGREVSVNDYHWRAYEPLFCLWREMISGQAKTNGKLIKDLLSQNRNTITGFLEYSVKNKNYKLMNIIIHHIVSSNKGYIIYNFGRYFKYMSDENLRLAKKCWSDDQMIIDVAGLIFSPKMIETLNKLTNLVGIDSKTIAEIIYGETIYELGLKCNLKELQTYLSQFENYIYKV